MRRLLILSLLMHVGQAVLGQATIDIALKQGSPAEVQTREQLQRLLARYDLSAWTYLHLLVCYLEQQTVLRILGELKAKQIMDFWATDHYTWVYKTVLERPRDIGNVVRSHKLIPIR